MDRYDTDGDGGDTTWLIANFKRKSVQTDDGKGDNTDLQLTDLPDSILLKIFKILPLDLSIFHLSKTCSRFKVLTDDFSIWTRQSVKFHVNLPKPALNKLRFFSSRKLQKIDLSGNDLIFDSDFIALLRHFRNIRYIDISRCQQLTNASLGYLATYPPIVRSLDLNGCSWFCPDLTLAVVTRHSVSLRHLNIGGCHRLTNDVHRVTRMAESCRRLKSLTIGWLYLSMSVQDTAPLSPIIDTDVRKFAKQCKNLTCLRLFRCHIGDDSITAIAHSCKHLEILNLSFTYISNNSMATISKHFIFIKELILTGCWKISDSGLVKLAEHRPKLSVLSLRRCVEVTARCLAHFLTLVPTLRELDVGKCFKVNDSVIDSIKEYCPRLGVLDIGGTSVSKHRIIVLKQQRLFPINVRDERRLRK